MSASKSTILSLLKRFGSNGFGYIRSSGIRRMEQTTGEKFSVDCSEDVAFITEADVAMASKGSFMGDTIIRARQTTCKIWNVRPVDPRFLKPVESEVPVLMLSGEDDPATPPEYGAEQVKHLPNGRQIIVANGTHDEDSPCLERLRVEFLERGSVKDLNADCAAANKRPPFATSMPQFLD